MKVDPEPTAKAISLSNDAVSSHINEMAGDTELQLSDILKHTDFTVQLHKTILSDKSLLMVCVRFARDRKLHEEFLL